jgi:hypothetical protein
MVSTGIANVDEFRCGVVERETTMKQMRYMLNKHADKIRKSLTKTKKLIALKFIFHDAFTIKAF